MISSTAIVLVFLAHFIADFPMQTGTMAENKSTSWKWLSSHIAAYTGSMIVLGIMFLPVMHWGLDYKGKALIDFTSAWCIFSLLNGLLHFFTDAITSRCTTYFYKKGDTHTFFTVIGFDQFMHGVTLILTFEYLVQPTLIG